MAAQTKKLTKKYGAAVSKVEADKLYTASEALALVKQVSFVKFDESVDLAVRLGVDPRHADQMVRGSVVLPHGTGKKVRILVFAKSEKAEEAKAAGADIVGDDELVEEVRKGFMDFDKVVATPDMMASVGKLGKILGPRGLMPNPKIGTVTNNVAGVVSDLKSGMVEFRVDKTGIVHVGIGRVSFGADKLLDNLNTIVSSLMRAKPASSKGQYVRGMAVSSTMGPGIHLDSSQVIADL